MNFSPSTILILTASFGEGHNTAAQSLQTAILECSPQTRVEVHDIFQESYGKFYEAFRKVYYILINHLPAVWNQVFEALDKSSTFPQASTYILFGAIKRLRNLLREMAPKVIISTFPGYGPLLDFLHAKGLPKTYTIVTLLTDSVSINSLWYRNHSDFFITPNEETAKVLGKAGISSHRIHSLGFPVSPTFTRIQSKKIPPTDGEKWKILYMVNASPQQAPRLVQHLLQLKNVEITVTVGKRESLRKTLHDLSLSYQTPVEIYGWTSHMPELISRSHILIGKAGGATVHEALAGRTPLLMTQVVPGQEKGNSQLILENGAGAFASQEPEVIKKLEAAFAKEGLLWKEWFYATTLLSRPDAALNITHFIFSQKMQ